MLSSILGNRSLSYAFAGIIMLLALPKESLAIGNLDAALLKEASTIIRSIRKQGHKTVGALPFGAKIEGAKLTRSSKLKTLTRVGPINRYMAEYLENALIYSNDPIRPLTILERPGEIIARKIKKPGIMSVANRKKLFQLQYPAYGSTKPITPDAFLLGTIALSSDYQKATIQMASVDPSGRVRLLHKFSFPTDQFVLGEMGIGFSYSRKYPKLKKFGSRSLYRNSPFVDLENLQDGDVGDPADSPTFTEENGPFTVSLHYDGTRQILLPDDSLVTEPTNSKAAKAVRNNLRVVEPAEGSKVEIHLTNNTNDVMGAVVMVGGKSTLYGTQRWEDAKRWILDPNETIKLKGFYELDGEKNQYRPFRVTDLAETQDLFASADEVEAGRLGQIEIHIFRPGSTKAALYNEAQRSLRRPSSLRDKRGLSPIQLYRHLNKNRGLNKRGLIVASDLSQDAKLKDVAFGEVARTDLMVIQYYQRTEP